MNKTTIKTINESLDQIIIPHPQYIKALDRSKALLGRSEFGLGASGFFLYGKAGVGKTTVINDLISYSNDKYSSDSIISTTLTGSNNFTQIVSSILVGMGDPLAHKGTGKEKLDRLIRGIKDRRTQLIIIDEFHHYLSAKNVGESALNHASNALKSLTDQANVSFLISGTDKVLELWEHDFQLRSRFQSDVKLTSFKYPKDRPIWRGIVKGLEGILNRNGFSINCKNFDDKLFNATHGNMRSTIKLLKEVVVLVALEDRSNICSSDLDIAASTTIDKKDGRFKSFSDSVNATEHYATQISSTELAPRTPKVGDVITQS